MSNPEPLLNRVGEHDLAEETGRPTRAYSQRQGAARLHVHQNENGHETITRHRRAQCRIRVTRAAAPEVVDPVVAVRSSTQLAQP